MDRIQVQQPDPIDAVDRLQLAQQLDQPDLAVEVEPVIGGVLRDDIQFAHAVSRQLTGLGHDHLDRFRDVLAAHLGDRTERAGAVATFRDFEIRVVPRRDPQPGAIVQGGDRRRPKQLALLAGSANQVVGHAVDLVAAENSDDVIDLGQLVEQCRAKPLRQTAGDNHAPRSSGLLEVEHLADHGFRLGPRAFDEAARVHDDEIGTVGIADQRVAIERQCAQHLLAVDQVLGTTEADEGITPLGVAVAGGRLGRTLGRNDGQLHVDWATRKKRDRDRFPRILSDSARAA